MRAEEFAVNVFSSDTIRRVSFFRGIKQSQVKPLAAIFYAGNELLSAFIKAHTFVTGSIIALKRFVLVVLGRSSFSKVFPAVVAFTAINMINFKFWPFAFYPEPDNAMGKVFFILNADFYSPLIIERSGDVANVHAFRKTLLPSKQASFWIIVKDLPYKIGSQIYMRVFWSAHCTRVHGGSHWGVKC